MYSSNHQNNKDKASETVLNDYSINVNSSKRDVMLNNLPTEFTIWINDYKDKSCIARSFKNVKYIAIEHIVFPNYIQMIKQILPVTDILYNDINDMMNDLSAEINYQYEYNGNSYEICNKNIKNGSTYINFTINQNKEKVFEYVKTESTYVIYTYVPISIDKIPNSVQYISLKQFDNEQIYNTHGHNMFKFILPRLKKDINLYSYLKRHITVFRDSNVQNLNKMQITLLDSNSQKIIINGFDFDYTTNKNYGLNEDKDYSSPEYYLRHPLNPRFQVDIFFRIGCYEKEIYIENVF